MDLMGLINKGRPITDVQLVQNIIDGYHFIDYALVTAYADRYVDVKLAHKLMNKDVVLTNVEVLNLGSKALSVQHTLVEGDIVMLFSSRAMINDMTDFTATTKQAFDCYNLATIKAVSIAATGKSLNTLTVNDDGSYTLVGEEYSVEVSADGSIAFTLSKDLTIEADTLTETIAKAAKIAADSILAEAAKKHELKGQTIELNGSSKSFVTHAELDTALTTLCTTITAHVHPTAAPGPPSPAPTLIGLTCNIAAAATTTIKTGG